MCNPVLLLLCLLAIISSCQSYFVRVETYDNGGCGGTSRTDDLDNLCLSFPTWGYSISGVFIPIGSCAIIHTGQQCGGNSYMISYPSYDMCDLPCCGWNDNVLSIEDCYTRSITAICPDGSYVREIKYGDYHQGLTMSCYKPTEDQPSFVYNTHDNPISYTDSTSCPIASHGLSFSYDDEWTTYYNPVMACSRRKADALESSRNIKPKSKNFKASPLHLTRGDTSITSTVNKISNQDIQGENEPAGRTLKYFSRNGLPKNEKTLCSENSAFVGIDAEIDDGGSIKSTNIWCADVPDPSQMCEPAESLGTVISCENNGGSELQCKYSQTIGVGESKTITETEREEMTFSVEFGYSIGSTISGLSASMSATLGMSELVGYEWSQSDTTTWSTETTVEAAFTVRPYTTGVLEQLIGKCSFYGTSVNYFRLSEFNQTTTSVQYFKFDSLGNKVMI